MQRTVRWGWGGRGMGWGRRAEQHAADAKSRRTYQGAGTTGIPLNDRYTHKPWRPRYNSLQPQTPLDLVTQKAANESAQQTCQVCDVGDAVVRLTSNFSRHTPLGKFRWSSFQSPLLAAALHLCQAFMRRTSRRTRVVASVTQRWTRLRLVAERRACRLW